MALVTDTPAQRLGRAWGKRLAAERKNAGYSQAAFAAMIQRDQPWVSRHERGRSAWTIDSMLLFAAALNKSTGELFEWPYGIEAIERFRLSLDESAA